MNDTTKINKEDLLGKEKEKQIEAVEALSKKEEPLTYEEIKEEIGLDDKRMQPVIRGLSYNGLVDKDLNSTGVRTFSLKEK